MNRVIDRTGFAEIPATCAESALQRAFDRHDLALAPAALAAIFDPEGVISWKATGEPRRDGRPVTRGSVFRIASMTKSFLAAAALELRDRGEFDLDRPIDAYVPGVRFDFAGEAVPVTVRQLLTNRSGLPEDNAWADRLLGADPGAIDALGAAGLRLTAEPDDRYQYSNLGMSYVGRAIEAVTGHAVEDEITERLLEPLGLAHTRFEPAAYSADRTLAAGFRTFNGGRSFSDEPYVGAGALSCIGGLFSTVDDVARWAAFLQSAFSDAPLHPEVLSARSRREMQRISTAIPLDAEPSAEPQLPKLQAIGYGMGLVVEQDRRFGRIVQHAGGLPGFSSHMRWHVPSGCGVVAFGNSDVFGAGGLATRALAEVLEAVDAPSEHLPPWPETLDAGKRIDDAVRTGEPLDGLAGLFSANVMHDLPAAVREQRLVHARSDAGPVSLRQQPFEERVLAPRGPAELRWRIACARGSLVCEIRLVGLRGPLVQSLAIECRDVGTAAGGSTI